MPRKYKKVIVKLLAHTLFELFWHIAEIEKYPGFFLPCNFHLFCVELGLKCGHAKLSGLRARLFKVFHVTLPYFPSVLLQHIYVRPPFIYELA